MVGRGNTADFGAVDEIERNNPTSSARRKPGENELSRIEDGAGADPDIGRRGVDVKVPKMANAERLQEILLVPRSTNSSRRLTSPPP